MRDEEDVTERVESEMAGRHGVPTRHTDISPSYLEHVRERVFSDAVGVYLPSGTPTAIIRRMVDGELVEVEVPRWRVANLMPRSYRADGEQLEFRWPASRSVCGL